LLVIVKWIYYLNWVQKFNLRRKKSLHYKDELADVICDNMSNCSWFWKSA